MAYSISSTDHLCYPGTTVLVNKLGISDQKLLDEAEAAATAIRTIEILDSCPNDRLTPVLIQEYLFMINIAALLEQNFIPHKIPHSQYFTADTLCAYIFGKCTEIIGNIPN